MKKLLFILTLIALCSVTAFAQEDNEGTCGNMLMGQFVEGEYAGGTSTSDIKLPKGELLLDVDYSGYDTLAKLKAKNPGITFSQIKYPGDNKGRTQFKTVLGQSPITTEATFTFNSKGRLGNVIIKKKGAALNVYEPLVEKYTQIYGNPKSSTPFTTDLRQNASFATCSFEDDKKDTLLLLTIPLDGINVPSILLVENWKDKY